MKTEENNFYVYVHFSKKNDLPFYIGFGQKNRISTKSKRSKEWNDIVERDGYYYGFLKSDLSRSDANAFEKYCIKTFIELGFELVNKINGGSGNSKRKKMSPEGRKIVSENSRRFWKSVSDDYKKKFGEMMSSKLKGIKKPGRTESHRLNQSISHMGQIPWNKNKRGVYTEDTIEKLKKNNANNKSILVVSKLNDVIKEFISISEASRVLKISRIKIFRILNNKIKNNTDYYFYYKNELNKD